MTCYSPLNAVRTNTVNKKTGKKRISFNIGTDGEPIRLPCGQCIGCRIDRSRQWAIRCVNEASLYDDNVFITLTYNDENLPYDGSLRKSDVQKFFKRLRKHIFKETGKKIRYYYCGEYGEKNNRPHYHAIIFDYNFSDWIYLHSTSNGSDIYTSPTLERIWNKGFVSIGTVNFQSVAYIARYILKKINGKNKEIIDEKTGLKPYERIDRVYGEIVEVLPEFTDMSRRPGIGRDWFDKYRSDFYPKDFTNINGMRVKPPRYYDTLLEQVDFEMYDDIKNGRMINAFNSCEDNESRLRQKKIIKESQVNMLKRNI